MDEGILCVFVRALKHLVDLLGESTFSSFIPLIFISTKNSDLAFDFFI
ncbi:hypothetical protein RchiOBHm_Chr2g0147231 [Rosa chinensis]|uniref:Uncharacterized protein n=1 Tax=Rosa chinensis TaxID=74649 RepID=A0A2P6RZ30_ROSCH|nr:hypothetical protein RchiOBHm_Chr2g0147231 [Rosa chinensis]